MTIKLKLTKLPDLSRTLKIRKDAAGNLLIFDHEDIDIVVMTEKNKIVTFPDDMMDDKVYSSQSRLFKHLIKDGVVKPETVHAGNIYGSMEAKLILNDDFNTTDLAVFAIANWLKGEREYFIHSAQAEKEEEERLLEPDKEDSTELGEVPHAKKKGGVDPSLPAVMNTQRYF